MTRLIPYLLALALTAAAAYGATVDRILRRFDFEERAAGNVEDVPMDWIKLEGPGLPHYVNGSLTTEQACSGKYSFGFTLDGGSLIYRYPAGKIIAHPTARYRLHVLAKTQELVNARARMSAYFADAKGVAIRSSVQHSKPLLSTTDEWSPIDLDLTAPDGAASLVIELGLVQPVILKQAMQGDTTAFEQDITGRAWFDDLTVAQVPYVRLSTSAAGNVFRRSEPAVINVSISDRFTEDLIGRLEVHDADGQAVFQRSGSVDVQPVGDMKIGRMVLPEVPAGWYRANLLIESHGTEVGRQSVDFVQLADDAAPAEAGSDARIGVIATGVPFEKWNDLPQVLPYLGASRVKLAVWSAAGDVEHAPGLQFNLLIDQLRDLRITPTACLIAPPPSVMAMVQRPPAAGRRAGDWPALAAGSADSWQTPLALMMSRYAGHLDRWQFGADDRAVDFTTDPKLRVAYDATLKTMNGLFSPADLAMPWPVYTDAPQPTPTTLALAVSTDVLPEHLPLYVNDALGSGKTKVSLTLTAPRADQYGRAAQVRDLAQRIGFSLASQATRIDLPLPFDDTLSEPTDTLLVQRTLVKALSGTTYQGRMPLGDDIDALLFDRDGVGVLLAWAKSPQATPKAVPVMLGRSPQAVDLNGNVSPVLKPKADDGTTEIIVGPTPGLVIGIDGMLARLRTSFAFDNPMLESSFKPHVRRLTFLNPYRTPLAGKLKVSGPAGWTITPQSPTFNVPAGEKYDGVLTIEFPFSSVAGTKTVELTVQTENGAAFKVPLTLRLGLGDLGVDSSAFRDGADVIVQQMITNYGTTAADYTAYASFPGAARQERMIRALAAGTTVIKRYRFSGVDNRGQKVVRSGVRETTGSRGLTDEVTLP